MGKLERMKKILVPEPSEPKSPGLPVKASKKAKKTPASPKCGSPTSKTEDLLNMAIPATKSSLGGSLLDEAMGTEPICVRKAVLTEAIAQKKPAAKRPAASAEAVPSATKKSKGNGAKKPQVADDTCFADHKLKLMPYNQTGAMAIRIDKGPQLIQIKTKASRVPSCPRPWLKGFWLNWGMPRLGKLQDWQRKSSWKATWLNLRLGRAVCSP